MSCCLSPVLSQETIECYASSQIAKTLAQKRIAFEDRTPPTELAAMLPPNVALSVTAMVKALWHVAHLCLAQVAQALCYFAAGKICYTANVFGIRTSHTTEV